MIDHSQRKGSPGRLALSTALNTSEAAKTRTPSERAHQQKQRCGEVLGLGPEAVLQQFISGEQVAAKIRGNENYADNNPGDDVTEHNLQIGEVAALLRPRIIRISQRRHSDECQRAGFSRDDRKTDYYP